MSGPPGGGPPFAVHCRKSPGVSRNSNERRRGRDGAELKSFQQIIARLQKDPFEAGEPLYRLPGLRMQIHTIALQPLAVDFAVCEDHPSVFIKGAYLLSGD